MSFPRYPKYKASGVEWLGEVPAHWEVTPLKFAVRLKSGGTPSKSNLEYWDGDVPWASSKDLKSERLSDSEDHITQKAVEDGAAELVPVGSLLIVVRGMILAHTFPVAKALVPMAINQDLKALTPRDDIDVDFLAWLLRGASRETLNRVDEAGHGTKVLRLDGWTSIELPIPTRADQAAIAAFLNRETATIDALVAEQQRLMELLQEKRQAVISHAVTRGLNPDAPMKPSGIEWLGEIPSHWKVWKLAHAFTTIGSGTTPRSDVTEFYDGGDVPWINTGDLNDGVLNDCERRITARAVREHSSLKLYPPGSLLIAMYGATIGKLGLVTFPTTVNQACCAFAGELGLTGKFLFYWFLGLRQQLLSLATGGGQPNVSQDILRSIRDACPDPTEQNEIVAVLDAETARLDALTAEAQRAIDLLQERRTALISAAVTGQIDVRGLAPSEAA